MHDFSYTATAVFVEGENGNVVGYIEELPGAFGQGSSIDEARETLFEAAELLLAANRRLSHESFASARVLRREAFRSARRRGQ